MSLTIHDVNGSVIRQIDLGYQMAGKYLSQDQAIYWDGRTETGEHVSSGTYFYTIQTDQYTQTRKMVILK